MPQILHVGNKGFPAQPCGSITCNKFGSFRTHSRVLPRKFNHGLWLICLRHHVGSVFNTPNARDGLAIFIYIYIYMHIYIYIYIHILHTHIYTYIYIYNAGVRFRFRRPWRSSAPARCAGAPCCASGPACGAAPRAAPGSATASPGRRPVERSLWGGVRGGFPVFFLSFFNKPYFVHVVVLGLAFFSGCPRLLCPSFFFFFGFSRFCLGFPGCASGFPRGFLVFLVFMAMWEVFWGCS